MEEGWIGLNNNAFEFFNSTAITEAFVDILVCAVPIWVAVMIGLLIGWSWRPRWAGLVFLGFRSKLRFIWTLPPGLGARRFWLAFTALSAFSLCRGLWFRSRSISRKLEKSSAQELVDSASNLAPPLAAAAAAQEPVAADDASHGDIKYALYICVSLFFFFPFTLYKCLHINYVWWCIYEERGFLCEF